MGKMKANRKFIEADERAVSAVIGVILMVAITVAIAATVYVYVSGMVGGTKKMAPSIMFSKDEAADRIIVATTDSGVPWSSLQLRSSAHAWFLVNAEVAVATGTELVKDTLKAIPATSPVNIAGSDFIDLEADQTDFPTGTTDVTITIVHADTSSILQTVTFSSITARA